MTDANGAALAREMLEAYTTGRQIPIPPSAREGGIDSIPATRSKRS